MNGIELPVGSNEAVRLQLQAAKKERLATLTFELFAQLTASDYLVSCSELQGRQQEWMSSGEIDPVTGLINGVPKPDKLALHAEQNFNMSAELAEYFLSRVQDDAFKNRAMN